MEKGDKYKKEQSCRMKPGESSKLKELEEVALHCSKLPRLELGSDGEIVGYDDSGVPE